jgi:hypothetical protein
LDEQLLGSLENSVAFLKEGDMVLVDFRLSAESQTMDRTAGKKQSATKKSSFDVLLLHIVR